MAIFCFSYLLNRRWLIIIYTFLSLLLFVYLIGYYSSTNHFIGYPWLDGMTTDSDFKTIMCLPKRNIMFLKTHKCASSSVQNILLRYAHTKNLTVVVPVLPKNNHLSLVRPFQKDMVKGAPWEILGYNILCHHMVFNKVAVEKIMPKDSVYISIVRNPVALFESLYEYENLEKYYKMNIEEYAQAIKNSSLIKKLQNRSNGMGRNQMLFDFGVHPTYYNNKAMIEKAILNIEKNFDFIMIAEYFDESIILLQHILCWELDDMISLTINARMANFRKNLSKEAIKNIQEWNWGDKMLYDHFLRKFEETLDEFGREQIAKEVKKLRQRREKWFNHCVETPVASKNLTSYKIWSAKVTGYMLKPELENSTCEDLVKPEKFFTNQIRQHQLLQSLTKGVRIPNYGPFSLRQLIDLTGLKGEELQAAKSLLKNRYKYRNKKIFPVKKQ